MKRVLGIAAMAVGLVLAGCGGDDDTSSQSDGGESTSDEATSSGEAPSSERGSVGARVTIGDEEYVAATQDLCFGVAGTFTASFTNDGRVIQIDIDLPPEDWAPGDGSDWDPPSIRVDVGDDNQFVAGSAELKMDGRDGPFSRFDEIVRGDRHASGTAVFVDNFAVVNMDRTPEPIAGTFEITCKD